MDNLLWGVLQGLNFKLLSIIRQFNRLKLIEFIILHRKALPTSSFLVNQKAKTWKSVGSVNILS